MPIAHRYLEAADLIVTVWDGIVTPDEWSAMVTRLLDVEGSAWATSRRRITDARTADTSMITLDSIEEIRESFDRAPVDIGGVRLAIVANQAWAVAQQAEEAFRELGLVTVVFNDVHTACAWMGVDADPVTAALSAVRAELRMETHT